MVGVGSRSVFFLFFSTSPKFDLFIFFFANNHEITSVVFRSPRGRVFLLVVNDRTPRARGIRRSAFISTKISKKPREGAEVNERRVFADATTKSRTNGFAFGNRNVASAAVPFRIWHVESAAWSGGGFAFKIKSTVREYAPFNKTRLGAVHSCALRPSRDLCRGGTGKY